MAATPRAAWSASAHGEAPPPCRRTQSRALSPKLLPHNRRRQQHPGRCADHAPSLGRTGRMRHGLTLRRGRTGQVGQGRVHAVRRPWDSTPSPTYSGSSLGRPGQDRARSRKESPPVADETTTTRIEHDHASPPRLTLHIGRSATRTAASRTGQRAARMVHGREERMPSRPRPGRTECPQDRGRAAPDSARSGRWRAWWDERETCGWAGLDEVPERVGVQVFLDQVTEQVE